MQIARKILRNPSPTLRGASFFRNFYRFSPLLPFLIAFGGLFPAATLPAVLGASFLSFSLLAARPRIYAAEGWAFFAFLLTVAVGILSSPTESLLRVFLLLSALAVSLSDAEKCRLSLAISGGISGGVALWEKLSGRAVVGWMDLSRFSSLGGRSTALFGNPALLAVFLASALPFALDGCFRRGRAFSFACVAFTAAGLFCTLSRVAILASLLSSIAVLFSRLSHPRRLLFLSPAALLALPRELLFRLLSVFDRQDTSGAYRLSLWKSVFRMRPGDLFFGVGPDSAAFSSAFLPHAAAGLLRAEHTHSLPLGLLVRYGALGLLSFSLLAFFLFHGLWKRRKTGIPLLSSLASLLLIGFTDDLFWDRRIFLLVFYLIGMAFATLSPPKSAL